MEQKRAFLDVIVSVCPSCKTPYVEASWYAIGLSSDIQCGVCGNIWNLKALQIDRILLEFSLDNKGKIMDIKKRKIT